MKFRPFNRHVLVFPVERKEADNPSTILVPDDYVKVKSPYEVYKILNVAADCEKVNNGDINQHIVVNLSLIHI